MQKFYFLFYLYNSYNNLEEKTIVDFSELKEFEKMLENLPKYQPSDKVLKNIFSKF